jgi:16S rRNA (adenine1518-N6/adenine1519-N6)-dimethyltransferase
MGVMAGPVKAKKHLGQHFLRNEEVALNIVEAMPQTGQEQVIEIGPGDGVLSKYLFDRHANVKLFDIDMESIQYLKKRFPMQMDQVHAQDFLSYSIIEPTHVIGNFPYNISSQIVFKLLEQRDQVLSMVGMFQKEVAERIASKEGNKVYGILSVLTQAFFDVEYLFTVEEGDFDPPPKVKSGVIRMTRKENQQLDCDEAFFFQVVKRSFNQRRKMIRKSLRDLIGNEPSSELEPFLTRRPEELHFTEFVALTKALSARK